MLKNKRLRIFAGPNGSGKSTLFEEFKKKYNPGFFVNADDIEKQLSSSGLIDLQNIGLKATEATLSKFKTTKEAQSLLAKSNKGGHIIDVSIKENFIVDRSKDTHSYESSFVAAFIRSLLYQNNKTFSFETVMSHSSKIDELKKAQKNGYKTYLYFVCTDNPEINVDRVANRVGKGGHKVSVNKIRSRYPDTLKNLYPAIKYSNRAYLFDNSGKQLRLIAEIFEGALQLKDNNMPQWFLNYVLPHYQV
jgi:predicted ABC-type ATPase